MPKIVQQIGSGTASSMLLAVAIAGFAATATTGAVWTFGSGAVINGCVFVIFTAGAGGAAGSGRILMRAVSFLGPECAEEPG